MTCVLPTLDLSGYKENKLAIRSEREKDFEKNYKVFAENLADSIAQQVIKNIQKEYSDPDNFKTEWKKIVCLSISDCSTANKLLHLAPEGYGLSPFNVWLEKYSTDETKNSSKAEEYFNPLMSMVGVIAEEKLKEIFNEFKTNPKHAALAFKVKWIDRLNGSSAGSGSCSFYNMCLSITAKINDDAIKVKETQLTSSAIEAHRVKRQKNASMQRWQMTALAIFIAVFIGALFFSIDKVPIHSDR